MFVRRRVASTAERKGIMRIKDRIRVFKKLSKTRRIMKNAAANYQHSVRFATGLKKEHDDGNGNDKGNDRASCSGKH